MFVLPFQRPGKLGVENGKFAPVGWKPNQVSSQADRNDIEHYVAPLEFAPQVTAVNAWRYLLSVALAFPRWRLRIENSNYCHFEIISRMGFIDDLQLFQPPGISRVEVMSAARTGIKDFGVNRKHVELLRSKIEK